jgi:hypothetical protein
VDFFTTLFYQVTAVQGKLCWFAVTRSEESVASLVLCLHISSYGFGSEIFLHQCFSEVCLQLLMSSRESNMQWSKWLEKIKDYRYDLHNLTFPSLPFFLGKGSCFNACACLLVRKQQFSFLPCNFCFMRHLMCFFFLFQLLPGLRRDRTITDTISGYVRTQNATSAWRTVDISAWNSCVADPPTLHSKQSLSFLDLFTWIWTTLLETWLLKCMVLYGVLTALSIFDLMLLTDLGDFCGINSCFSHLRLTVYKGIQIILLVSLLRIFF